MAVIFSCYLSVFFPHFLFFPFFFFYLFLYCSVRALLLLLLLDAWQVGRGGRGHQFPSDESIPGHLYISVFRVIFFNVFLPLFLLYSFLKPNCPSSTTTSKKEREKKQQQQSNEHLHHFPLKNINFRLNL